MSIAPTDSMVSPCMCAPHFKRLCKSADAQQGNSAGAKGCVFIYLLSLQTLSKSNSAGTKGFGEDDLHKLNFRELADRFEHLSQVFRF